METKQKEVSFVSRDQIEALEMEIAALPAGYISRKTINGKVPYLSCNYTADRTDRYTPV